MLSDFMKLGWSNIKKRKLRSWLTMIGIFIGIAAVVSLISLGQGLQKYIDDEFESLGRDTIMIQPRGGFGPATQGGATFTDKDVDALRKVTGVARAMAVDMKVVKIEFNDMIRYSYLMGVPSDPEGFQVYNELMTGYDIKYGREIRPGDSRKAVLGHYFYDRNLFEKNVRVGDKILLNDEEFEVVGFYDVIGNPSDDQNVYVSDNAMRDLYDNKGEYSFMLAKVQPGLSPTEAADRIERELRKSRGLEEGNEDFSVQTTEELLNSFNAILNIVQIVLVGIAGISLFVGGVGIMNTMYTAVIERTKEIGVMKAIGARNSNILLLFTIESGILGLLGGVIGVIIGVVFSESVELIATAVLQTTLLQAYFPWYLIVGSLAFSFIVGMLSGILPAMQASRMKPVDSLRYE